MSAAPNPAMECILGEWFDIVATTPDADYVGHVLASTIMQEDPSVHACHVNVVLHDYVAVRSNILEQDRSMDLCVCCRTAHADSISNGTPFVFHLGGVGPSRVSGNRKDLKCVVVVVRGLWSVSIDSHVQYISFSFYTIVKLTQYIT